MTIETLADTAISFKAFRLVLTGVAVATKAPDGGTKPLFDWVNEQENSLDACSERGRRATDFCLPIEDHALALHAWRDRIDSKSWTTESQGGRLQSGYACPIYA